LDDVEVKRQAQPIFMAQIESVAAVKQAEAIAAVDGVDTLFVGPADLNFDIKANNDTLTFNDALQMVATVAKKNGKQAGILNRDEADVETLHAQGYGVQAIDSDLAILRARYQELVKRFAREGE
jgi:2-dehydro-3-deoxyglucarate aldolase/4-hydroxy-2-oxoheptanedioate aldolase